MNCRTDSRNNWWALVNPVPGIAMSEFESRTAVVIAWLPGKRRPTERQAEKTLGSIGLVEEFYLREGVDAREGRGQESDVPS
jgi:hypothetical protein